MRTLAKRWCIYKWEMVQDQVLVDICSEDKDPYRFGFNGQMKVNEMSGVGNHNTAEFWEYDTRLGRRWNLDPVDQVSISNYSVNELNPILINDPNGDCPTCPPSIGEQAAINGLINQIRLINTYSNL